MSTKTRAASTTWSTPVSRPRRLWVWWTSGKDSAWSLHRARCDDRWEVQGLLGVVNKPHGRSETHGVRTGLVEQQARAVGLPLQWVEYDWQHSSKSYERVVRGAFVDLRESGVEAIAFSDLSAARHRERSSALAEAAELEPVFPLWGRNPRDHVSSMLAAGLSARISSVVTEALPAEFAGRRFDTGFLADLPAYVDVCGEADEFHTFVEWAPGWNNRVAVTPKRTIDRYGMAVADLWGRNSSRTSRLAVAGVVSPTDWRPFHDVARLRRLKRFVDAQLTTNLRVDAVAAHIGLTPSGFGRFFRRHVGFTFGHYVALRRVDMACRFLRDPDVPVTIVARSVGLGTDRNLRRVFKKVAGCTPSEYRESLLRQRWFGSSSDRLGTNRHRPLA